MTRLRPIAPGHWESEDGRHVFKKGWMMLDLRTGRAVAKPTLAQAFDESQKYPAPDLSLRVCGPGMPSRYYPSDLSEGTVRGLYCSWLEAESGDRIEVDPNLLTIELVEGAAEPILRS